MSKESICERERNQIKKLNKFQLGHQYKKVGYAITISAFVLLILKKYIEEPHWLKPTLLGLVLVGLLIVSISREKIEDEFIDSLRSQSYRLSFLLVVIYSLVQPLINFGVGYLLNQDDELKSFGYFQVLFFMLIIQLLFFWKLKRFNK